MLTEPEKAFVLHEQQELKAWAPLKRHCTQDHSRRAILSRTLPFALFMAFIAVDEIARIAAQHELIAVDTAALYYLYPLKAMSVAALLFLFRRHYGELTLRDVTRDKRWLLSVFAGIATFCLWISMDWTSPLTGASAGFNPALLPGGVLRVAMVVARVSGAVLVVPVMEELFWRSFLARYLVDADFRSVAIGRFTISSFLITTVFFGLEHHLFFAGMTAGAIYNLVLYKTRSIAHCVLAHAVTNLALASYVLISGRWYFW